jgi:hypothetical protein
MSSTRPRKQRPSKPDRAGSAQANAGRFTFGVWAVCAQVLAQRTDRAALFDLLGFLHWLGDQNAAAIQKHRPALPCKEGCSFCCYVGPDRPDLLTPEVLRITAFLSDAGGGRLARVRSRLAQVGSDVVGGSIREPGRQACVFLHEERCLVYPVRPLRCRAQYSSDVEACRQYHLGQRATMPVLSEPALLYQSLLVGFQLGFREAGLSDASLALTPAVTAALQEPDISRRWLNHEAVFEASRLPQQADEERLIARLARQGQHQVQAEKERVRQLTGQFRDRPGAWALYSTTGVAPLASPLRVEVG